MIIIRYFANIFGSYRIIQRILALLFKSYLKAIQKVRQYPSRILWTCQKNCSPKTYSGTTLFVYINNLQRAIYKCEVRLYADNAYIFFFHQKLSEIELSIYKDSSNKFH